MYQILYAAIGENGKINSYDWSVLCEGFPSITEACASLARETQIDMLNGSTYAYQIVEMKD